MRSNRLETRLRKAEEILKPKRPRIIDILRKLPPNHNRQPISPREAAERIVEETEAKDEAFRSYFNLPVNRMISMAAKLRQEFAFSLMLVLRSENSATSPNWNEVNE